jgi:hypothetical protein
MNWLSRNDASLLVMHEWENLYTAVNCQRLKINLIYGFTDNPAHCYNELEFVNKHAFPEHTYSMSNF